MITHHTDSTAVVQAVEEKHKARPSGPSLPLRHEQVRPQVPAHGHHPPSGATSTPRPSRTCWPASPWETQCLGRHQGRHDQARAVERRRARRRPKTASPRSKADMKAGQVQPLPGPRDRPGRHRQGRRGRGHDGNLNWPSTTMT